ncbi:MAG: P1 family peptidase [Clostridiales bacterium]|nr:P1 family peptidase [Clostridiales bacterium]
MAKPLFQGAITDVHGIRVGQAQDERALTGVTVVLCGGEGAVVGADSRGAATGTREMILTRSEAMIEKANAVVLTGGSAYGLDSAGGVMRFLEEAGIGYEADSYCVPIVPAAVLFDLMVGDGRVRPDAAMGYEACKNAMKTVQQGAYGAGTGATIGKFVPGAQPVFGGTGTASITLPDGVTVGAVACVNACGDVYHPHTGKVLACGRLSDGKPVTSEGLLFGTAPAAEHLKISQSGNTTLVVVATDAIITKPQANRIATCAHDGLARAIRPVHTQMDGDTVFALATGRVNTDVNMIQLCAAAAEVTARAIANAAYLGGKR